jgi:hypothetical protein
MPSGLYSSCSVTWWPVRVTRAEAAEGPSRPLANRLRTSAPGVPISTASSRRVTQRSELWSGNPFGWCAGAGAAVTLDDREPAQPTNGFGTTAAGTHGETRSMFTAVLVENINSPSLVRRDCPAAHNSARAQPLERR